MIDRMIPDWDVVDRFAAVAQAQPDAPALMAAGPVVSYGACVDAVARLAEHLQGTVAAGQCVAVSLRRGPAPVIVMLACLSARVPYVPIDVAAPAHRRRQILADADPSWIFVEATDVARWRGREVGDDDDAVGTARLVTQGGALPAGVVAVRRPAAAGHLEPRGDGADLAYVLYTSGSTGQPKGVMITRRNAGAFVAWAGRQFPLGPADRVAVHAPLHFDLPVYDVFVALTSGASLQILDERTVLFPAATHSFLRERRVTALYAVPSSIIAMVARSDLRTEGLPELRQLLFAGEEFHVPRLRELVTALPAARLANLYGPVETNVVTWQDIDPAGLAGSRVPIGRPVEGTQVRLRRGDGTLAGGEGTEGEIVVSGPSVSPGYLGDADRTAATRLTTVDAAGVRTVWYRTGDFARFDGAGRLHFLGRRDGMIKTRGFRVELGDVEATLANHPDVLQAAVVPVSRAGADTLLEAHVVTAEGSPLTERAIQRWVAACLPTYMVPARVYLRAELPLTSTGKIARAELTEGSR
jgi:L-proline---[L-prolyl-carrier protein] ligase